jgi:hypothetical protein
MSLINLRIFSAEILEKHMKSQWDCAYKCIVGNDHIMKFHLLHDDGDEFVYAKLLFCSDIQTIYITHIYGYNFHSFEEPVEFWELDGLYDLVEDEMVTALLKMYPKFSNVKYFDEEDFTHEVYDIQRALIDQACVLSNSLPYNVVDQIIIKNLPSWTQYQHDPTFNLKDHFALDNTNYDLSCSIFDIDHVQCTIHILE